MPDAETYSPEPNRLERGFADYLARHVDSDTGGHPSPDCVQAISSVSRWIVGLSALMGMISGGLIGGGEIWIRQGIFDGLEDVGWRESLPYWAGFYAFVGVLSAVEIALLYWLALKGTARISRHAGLPLSGGEGSALLAHSLARAALEFPSPQVKVYGVDPYAYVSRWKLTALNLAYKLKVGVSSFIIRVFLRRVAARVAIRGLVPLMAAPLYAFWNAFILWRIMTEAKVRALGPFAVDRLVAARFHDADEPGDTEKDVILLAAAEMLARGRQAHPNQVYLLAHLREVLGRDGDLALDWDAARQDLPRLEAEAQARVLDVMTVSCIIGRRVHSDQRELLNRACEDCGMALHDDRLKALRKALTHGHDVTADDVSATRSKAPSA